MKLQIKCKGSTVAELDELVDFQGNLKTLSKENYNKFKNNLDTLGFSEPISIWINKGKKYILNGHQRVITLKKMRDEGWEIPSLPVNLVEADNIKQAKRKVLALTSQFGEITFDGFKDFCEEAELEMKDILDQIAFPELADLEAALEKDGIPEATGEDDIPEEVKPITKMGDLIQLGKHRLLCGDSTKKEDVERLMNGKKVNMLLTDPPYGVNYSSKNEMLNKLDDGNRIQKDIENDAIDDYRKFFKSFLQIIPMSQYNTCYITMAGQELHSLRLSFQDAGFYWSDYLIWSKNNHVLGRKDYSAKHEFVLYGWKNKHKFYGGFQTTVIEINRPTKSELHPTMKPIELFQKFIIDGSKKEMNIYDPFLGSGSTLIACEKTNRICYGTEIDPHYCDVIVERYRKFCNSNNFKCEISSL